MKLAKASIKQSFSKAAKTYDRHSGLQMETALTLADRLKDLCADSAPARILDVGCGTAHLTGLILKGFPSSCVYACDFSGPMLDAARGKTGGMAALVAGDSEALPFADSSFDAIASNLAYQWSCDVALAFTEAARVLKPGGVLAFSTLGPATLMELKSVYPKKERLPSFPGAEMLNAALIAAGFETLNVETRHAVKSYADLFELLRVLRKIGASPRGVPPPRLPLAEKSLASGSALRLADAVYKRIFPSLKGGITATYELIFASARKKA